MPAPTGYPDHPEHIATMRQAIAELRGEEDAPGAGLAVLGQLVDFAECRGLYFAGGAEANLWGFGTARIVLDEPGGGFWMRLFDLAEPAGLTDEQLYRVFLAELADQQEQGRDDDCPSVLYLKAHGARDLLVHHDFVMRLFATHSPWRAEFFANTQELMRHAMIRSGLGDALFGSSPTGFTVVATLRTDDDQPVKLSMPVLEFDPDNVPIVAAPFDDAEGERIPITHLADTWEVHRATDVARDFFGPTTDEAEATRRAFRGPVIA
ncbi:hypothetical protein [Thermomonospora cellulosilytica]|uniref:Uncharacterized protein n=1 Tax=Thermomonospora cellulosilytica TaxID=1411118 RepID=A0A7W3R6W4_9ACTN|nr:hypothetical protein [Thermomonospora cellulosilytica]MBA9002027.1 hypothetical protein [Thermomonospora cellulosilytica]